MEGARFHGFTPKAANWCFNIREKEYDWIRPKLTFNVDKAGIIAGFGERTYLLLQGTSETKKAYLKSDQGRGWSPPSSNASVPGASYSTRASFLKGKAFKHRSLKRKCRKSATGASLLQKRAGLITT
ncbi:hypothetical protein B0T26DRAFT_788191 [Lasiosphaeria miniovina]|uniref:Uncharacterized protein n=1 Tax=Lasiosphaeria miniovina TaxID=1954250 RepID=A0AA39ZYJ5_9PEZI|nr:uncharacterized protein B0T26DRAFT_788191 [Lasiosphaeria miniovina]KAK0705960.1 hypothetical protein B0T26DRAFT_788191 [Lasiosphaeria miniovina]